MNEYIKKFYDCAVILENNNYLLSILKFSEVTADEDDITVKYKTNTDFEISGYEKEIKKELKAFSDILSKTDVRSFTLIDTSKEGVQYMYTNLDK